MKKSVKFVAILAAIAATATCFASCGSNDGKNGSVPTLKWIQIAGQPNDLQVVTDEMNRYSEEKIGVKCEFTYLDWGVWAERVKAILNSGEPFDIMFTNGDVYTSAISLGRYQELDEMLANAPGLTELIPENVWEGAKVNGKIYGVPTYKDNSQTQYWVWSKKYVDQYNIDYQNMHTLADMDETVRMLQDEIKAGNITETDYAFYCTKFGVNGQFMNYDSIIPGTQLGVRFDDDTATVVRILEQPEIMEQFEYLHAWYKDGIINPDAPTVQDEPKWKLVSSAQGFPTAEISWGENLAPEGVVVEPWGGPVMSSASILGSINSISSSSQYKEEALKYLEFVNTDQKMRNMFAFGVEGVHWNLEDGHIVRVDGKKDDYLPATYSQANYFNLYPLQNEPEDKWDQVNEWCIGGAQESVLLGFSFDRTPVENEITACNAVTPKYEPNLYTGAEDPAELIPAYYAELEAAGLQKIQDELQKQINEFLGK